MKPDTAIKITASILLIISSISKLIFVEPFEFSLVESGLFSWEIAPIAIRGIIVLEFLLGVSLLLKSIHSKLFSISVLLLCGFYMLDFFGKPLHGLYSNEFSLSLFNKWLTLGGILYLVVFSIYHLRSNKINSLSRVKNILLNVSLTAIISTPLLIINPIFIDDLQKSNTTVNTPSLDWSPILNHCDSTEIAVNNEESTFFAFLSTSCYYCNRSAQMLGISKRAKGSSSNIILVFPGTKEDTDAFIKRNKCDFPHIRVSTENFSKISGASLPSFYKVINGKETDHLTGQTLNYRELDNLFE